MSTECALILILMLSVGIASYLGAMLLVNDLNKSYKQFASNMQKYADYKAKYISLH